MKNLGLCSSRGCFVAVASPETPNPVRQYFAGRRRSVPEKTSNRQSQGATGRGQTEAFTPGRRRWNWDSANGRNGGHDPLKFCSDHNFETDMT